ncbi:MAG: hypothetical protein AAB883_01780, partial [Patescibacteria group bacterium]
MQHHSTNHLARGMTLAETIVVVAIVAVVGIALTGAIQYFYRNSAYLLEQTAALDNARRGHSYTLQNLREASYGDDGSYLITNAATSTITFYADVDQDTGIERVRAYLSGTTLYRGVTNSAGNPASYSGQPETIETIAVYVKNATSTPIFTYYNAAGTQLTSPVAISSVRSVGVRIDTDLNPNRAPNL